MSKKKNKDESVEITIKRRVSGEVPEVYHFHLTDGRKLGSMYELIEALDSMSDEVFNYHVNDTKNDFSSWVKEVMKEDILAEELNKVQSKMDTQLKLLKHVVKKVLE